MGWRRWGGVARSQIALGLSFFFFLHSYNRLEHVYLFLAAIIDFPEKGWGQRGIWKVESEKRKPSLCSSCLGGRNPEAGD